MEYDEEEYNKAQETVDFYNARAITVLRNLGNAEYLKWFNDCEETFVSVYDKNVGNCKESIVRVVLWMGYEYEPSHRVVEFPWELMNAANVHIPNAYAKWSTREEERLAAAKEIKDKYWAEVRDKYENSHFGIEVIARKGDKWEQRLTCFDVVTLGMKACVDFCTEVAKSITGGNIKRKTTDSVTFDWENDWEITLKAAETEMPIDLDFPPAEEIAKIIETRLLQAIPD